MKTALITGSNGMLGSEMVESLCKEGWMVIGIDNNTRKYLFGENGSTQSIGDRLMDQYSNYTLFEYDIRNELEIKEVFCNIQPTLILHAAAQPSHQWSINHALEDFDINAVGTMNMLENYRLYAPDAVFIHVSSSKVYGDSVNNLPLIEYETRYDLPKKHKYYEGVDEEFGSLDGNLHSLFGASKACGDIMALEYGRYFGLPIGVFRPVCITSSSHKGVPLHGYLAYLVKCIATGEKYIINGYKGKQVRDNIHAYDLVQAFMEFYNNPKMGKAYNIGAGRESNNSILEAIDQAEKLLGKKGNIEYDYVTRRGDHIWCVYSSSKFRKDYPNWKITKNNDAIMKELTNAYL